ncbi:MAG: DUF6262 family protein [Scytonema sp. PMC 1069.18]|nr:DUF6262 family protein [Scytonema sp. PMC 1069.18]MEC4888207.1 DUF6262 family protein [Scytonema sp. PMC 1070.18]
MNDGKNKRIAALSHAAQEKKRFASEATDKAIRKLTSSNQPITIANVARLAGVSTSYIYKYPELKERIHSLSHQQRPVPSQKTASNNSQATIIYTLRSEIKRLNAMLLESKQANQLLIGKLSQQQDTQKLLEHLKLSNQKQAEQIQQLQSESDFLKQELELAQAPKVCISEKIVDFHKEKKSAQILDSFPNEELQSELKLLGIKLNEPLKKLVKSSSQQQVKNALSVVKEALSTGTKVRSKVGLFRKALESGWVPSQSDEDRVASQLENTFSEWYCLAKASGIVIASQKTEQGIIVYEPNGQAISFETMLERGWTLEYLRQRLKR